MNANMLTWNVDWLRNGKRSGKDWEYLERDCLDDVYTQIINIVRKYIDMNENAVAFLNEFPYKFKSNGKWRESPFFQILKDDFPPEEYDIYFNKMFATNLSLAISKRKLFQENEIQSLKHNRIISVKKDDLIMIGVHMPTNFIENDDYDKLWIALKSYICKCSLPTVVLGDFNAYVGCNEKLTENRYLEILQITDDVVPKNETTYIGKTLIDHILIKNVSEKKLASVQKEFQFSDHKYITYSINT